MGDGGFCPDCTTTVTASTTFRCLSCPRAADLGELIGRVEPGRPFHAAALELYLGRGLGREIAAAVDAGLLTVVSDPPDAPTIVARS